MRNMELAKQYPNLWISGDRIWICRYYYDGHSTRIRDGAATNYKLDQVTPEELKALNDQVIPAVWSGENYFFCSECSQVKERVEYHGQIFAGHYCNDCAKKPELARDLEMSGRRGFYE